MKIILDCHTNHYTKKAADIIDSAYNLQILLPLINPHKFNCLSLTVAKIIKFSRGRTIILNHMEKLKYLVKIG